MVRGPAKGLQLLKELDADPRLGHQYRLDAVRAHHRKRVVTAEQRSNSIELRGRTENQHPRAELTHAQAARLAADSDSSDKSRKVRFRELQSCACQPT